MTLMLKRTSEQEYYFQSTVTECHKQPNIGCWVGKVSML